MEKNKLNKRYVIAVILVIFIYCFLRFYQLDKRIGFDWDQERDAYVIKQLLVDHKPTLIGPRVVDVNGFFLGPYYSYLLAPFYILSGLHPRAIVYFVIAVDSAFALFAFFIIKKLWGVKHSLIFLLLWGINPLLIAFDTSAWNPLLIPVGIITLWWLLYKLDQTKKTVYWFLLGVNLAIGIHFHFQYFFLCLFTFYFLYISRKTIATNLVKVLLFFFPILFFLAPLIIFDIRHDYLNTHLFLNFFSNIHTKEGYYIFNWTAVLSNFLYQITTIKIKFINMVVYSLIIGLFFLLSRKKSGFQRRFYQANVFLFLITPLFFMAYGQKPSEYYFLFLYLFIYIGLAEAVVFWKKYQVFVLLLILNVLIFTRNIFNMIQPHQADLYYKDLAVQEVRKINSQNNYQIVLMMPFGRDNGFRYLINYYGMETDPSVKKGEVILRIPPAAQDKIFGDIGVY